jgi:hypothetical protein
MSILNNIWNRIARKPDRRKAAATEFSETGNRVYAVATEEGVMLFSDTPKGMKARNSYLQHLADGFFNVAKVPETLRIYEMDLPTKRVAELADNCIEKTVQSGFAEYGRTIAQIGGELCSRQVRGQKRSGRRCVQGEVRPAARFP